MESIRAHNIKTCACVGFSLFCVSLCGWQVFYISDLYFTYGTSVNVYYDQCDVLNAPAVSMSLPIEVMTNRTKLLAFNSSLEAEIRGLRHRSNRPDNELHMRDAKLIHYVTSKIAAGQLSFKQINELTYSHNTVFQPVHTGAGTIYYNAKSSVNPWINVFELRAQSSSVQIPSYKYFMLHHAKIVFNSGSSIDSRIRNKIFSVCLYNPISEIQFDSCVGATQNYFHEI